MQRWKKWRRLEPLDEFERIAKLMAPLAAGEAGAFGLTDDAAVLTPKPGEDWVVTKDAIVAGVHFTGKEAAGDIARKLMRVKPRCWVQRLVESPGLWLWRMWR